MKKALRTALVVSSAVILPVAGGAADKYPKCFSASREGHCIAVQLNGVKAARLSGKTKKMLKAMGALELHAEEVRYEIATPVRGTLDLQADWIPGAATLLGANPEVEAFVVPLEGQSLDTERQLSTDSSVQVGGSAAVRQDDVLKENRLRPGKYLMTVRVRGTGNWDRQLLFFQVAE
ncbi:MAG TPA: hypothetical protein VFM29_03295 [Vicinamibacteria bacterium]|nr:hypothetical protein [Vicinamibacteria bacterium]